MKGYLQYSLDDVTYKDCGTVRTRKGQGYKLKALSNPDRVGDIYPDGWRVQVKATALELNTDFLDYVTHYFRIVYYTEMEMIKLGSRPYLIDYDGILVIREIEYHVISLDFFIESDEYGDYAIPVPLPESEGGVLIEDSGIYIEVTP